MGPAGPVPPAPCVNPARVLCPAWLQPERCSSTDLSWTAAPDDVDGLESGASKLLLVDPHDVMRPSVLGRPPVLVGKQRKPTAVGSVVGAESMTIPEDGAITD